MKSLTNVRLLRFVCIVFVGSTLCEISPAQETDTEVNVQEATPEALDFFEKKIRPVLVQHCYECHSSDSRTLQGNFNLEHAAGLRAGGDSGAAIVSGRPEESLLIKSLRYDGYEMPPTGKLPEQTIRDFEAWINSGAADPRVASDEDSKPAGIDVEAGRNYWAFQPPALSPALATFAEQHGKEITGSQRIDWLVVQQLKEKGITPNGPADRRALLRRISIDLTGLPPTPTATAAFVQNESPQAIAEVVDGMLASPAYGERWARLWLDVARYAEDQAHIVGDNKELFYPNAYRYRDWVINSMNADMPYDRFVRLQLAADSFAADDESSQSALGFIGLGPKYYRRGDPEVMAEEWEDRVDVVASGLQGLTVACARCHDHKYDPIPTQDYYALAGVFASTEMYNKPLESLRPLDTAESTSTSSPQENGKATAGSSKKSEKKKDPSPDECIHIVRDKDPRDLKLMIRGNVHNTGPEVPRGFLQVAFPGPQRRFADGSGRKELAEAITDRGNPLTARVIVNRIWAQYFGRGIVGTPSNFGQLGEQPTHPELLDDLSVGFMENGWSLKWLHRQILLSQTYQRSSEVNEESLSSDPVNLWLWRMPRRRLSVEAWRDGVLFVSGRLDPSVGGSSIHPDDPQVIRRTIYSEVSRFQLNPLLARFDFPDPNVHSARRNETNTPLQKLFLLNSPFMLVRSEHFSDRIKRGSEDPEEQIRLAFQYALQRDPSTDELSASLSWHSAHPEKGLSQFAQALLTSNEFWFLD
jgi:mono/diheme cytochrome c family protein